MLTARFLVGVTFSVTLMDMEGLMSISADAFDNIARYMSELIVQGSPNLVTIESRVMGYSTPPLMKFEHLKLKNLSSLTTLDFLNSALGTDALPYSPDGSVLFIELSELPNLRSLGLKTPLLVRPAAELKIITDKVPSLKIGADLCFLENALK